LVKTNQLQAPCFKQSKTRNQTFVTALQALCALWLQWKRQQIYDPSSFT